MQQRAAIVRALVQDPRLLLMDEPFGALDAMTREQMNLELMRIWSQSRKTVIFITHSIAEAIFLSDRVIAMTARPGTIADVITIDLPRPRELSVINTDRFGRYAAQAALAAGCAGRDVLMTVQAVDDAPRPRLPRERGQSDGRACCGAIRNSPFRRRSWWR